jgi:hypothetical protein
MALMTKEDLLFRETYEWEMTPEDEAAVREGSDRPELNRFEGYAVLQFINEVANDLGLTTRASGHKIELMLATSVPREIRGRREIKAWIAAELTGPGRAR